MNFEQQPNALTNCTKLVSSRSQIECCKFSPSGNLLAACFSDGSVRLYTITICSATEVRAELKHHFKEHLSNVWSISFSNDGKHLASTSSDCSVIVYLITNLTVQRIYSDHCDTVWCCAFSRLSLLATGSKDCTVKLYDQESGEMVNNISNFNSTVLDLSFNDAGDKLCTVTSNGEVIVWVNIPHHANGAPPTGLLIHSDTAVNICKFITSCNSLIACTTHPNHDVIIFDVSKCIAEDLTQDTSNITEDYNYRDVRSFADISKRLSGHCNIVWSFCFLHDPRNEMQAKMLISCSGDRTIR